MNSMTRIIALIVLAKCLYVSSNFVSSTKKVTETSTVPNHDFSTDKMVEKSKVVFNTSESNVYLEDVLYALRSQEWAEEEIPCLNRTLVLLRNLQNFTLWSVWQWDSMSSQPLGLLYGSQYHLGNYDECLNTPWRESHPELQSKYCLADIVLQRTDRHVKKLSWNRNDPYQSTLQLIETKSVFAREIKKLTWGMCVPAECAPRSVERLTRVMLAHTHLSMAGLSAHIAVDETCQDVYMDKRYDGSFYAFIGLLIFLMTIAVICTLFNDKTNKYQGLGSGVIKAFDIRSNMSNMMTSSDELHVLYGIKFMSMCVVVIGHQIGMFNSGPVSNGVNMDEDSTSFLGLLFLHDDIVVDSFFMLSGFLTATTITKMKNRLNPLIIFKRYTRLVVPYALVMFYVVAIFPYTGSGPLWSRAVSAETAQCRQNWWLNLLMVSNYVDTENACIIISWYIPSDFHFFVVTLFLYSVYRRSPALGKLLLAAVTMVSILLPGISTYVNQFPPIHAFNFEFISNPRGSKQFNDLYIKSHMRYSTYIIGFLAGHIYVRPALIDHLKRLSQTWLTTIVYLSTVGIFACMYLGSVLYWREYDAVVSAVYAALNRPLWALGLSLVVLCCSIGHVPYIKAILSWYPWVPLSRLSYGVYLIHSMLITRNVFITRNLQFHDVFLLATSCAGIVFWSHLAALLMWVVAEAPINNLVTLMMKQGYKRNDKPAGNTEEKPRTHDNRVYLEDNMPHTIPTIQIISSKC